MTYYDILEIKPEATPEIVQAAYKAQKKKYHLDSPDTCDIEQIKKINKAYEVLSDPERRSIYDQNLKEGLIEQEKQTPKEETATQLSQNKKRLGWYLSWPVLFIVTIISIPIGIVLLVWRCLKITICKDLYKRKRRTIFTVLYLVAFITFIYPVAKDVAKSENTINVPSTQSIVQTDTSNESSYESFSANEEVIPSTYSQPKLPSDLNNTKDWNTTLNVNDSPNLFEIGGTVYAIAGMSKENVQNIFPNAEDYEENCLLEKTEKVMFHFDNYGIVDSVFLYAETDSLYKNVRVGMTEAEITETLGSTDCETGSGEKFWAYDIHGNRTNDESCFAYLICPSYDESGKAQMLVLAYYHQPISEFILVSIEYNHGISDISGKDAEIYLDGVYMVTIPSGDTRILMIPHDEDTHEITVKKQGFKTASATFGLEDYSSMDERVSCVGYNANSSLGYMHIEETDFEYAMEEFFPLYVVLIDGSPVELINIQPTNWMNVFRDFAQQY